MKKKNIIIGVIAAAAVIVAAFFTYRYFIGRSASGTPTVYVNKISGILALQNGSEMKYAGVVEPQETWNVKLQDGRTVSEVYVKAGDSVNVGTPLFIYDTTQATSDLAQAQLDSEKLDNDISNYNAQIPELTAERDKAPDDMKLDYTTQIQEVQMNIKKAEYDKKSKEAQIKKLQDTIDNATVTSEIDGVVKSVASTESNTAGSTDNTFISILTTGNYRVKGTVNEQNIGSVSEGAKVIVRSRVDSTKTWTGTMGKVDTQSVGNTGTNTGGGTSAYYFGATTDSSVTSTNYPFYVALDGSDGLMLGQHVYIEIDNGQGEAETGLWLPEYFIVDTDSTPYVWADDGKGKLIKKYVTLGSHNDEKMTYEITGGLTEDDEITFPDAGLEEGMTTGLGAGGQTGLVDTGSGDSTYSDEGIAAGGTDAGDAATGDAAAGDAATGGAATEASGTTNMGAGNAARTTDGGAVTDGVATVPSEG